MGDLHVAACPCITAAALQECAGNLCELRVLDAGYCMQLGGPQALMLSHDKLEVLSLWGCKNLAQLSISGANLREINLRECKSLDASFAHVSCPSLQCLDTCGCEFQLQRSVGPVTKRMRMAAACAY